MISPWDWLVVGAIVDLLGLAIAPVINLSIIFSSNDHLISQLIRWRTDSDFSHVELAINPEAPRSAVPFRGVDWGGYVDFNIRAEFKLDITDWQANQIREFYAATKEAAYDWCGALGLGINRDWQNPDRWYCSEWCAEALRRAEVISLPSDCVGVTPGDLFGLFLLIT